MQQIPKQIRAKIDSGDVDNALQLSRDALTRTPFEPELLGLAGVASVRAGHTAGGIAMLEAASHQAPNNTEWLSFLCNQIAEQFDRCRVMPEYDQSNRIIWPEWVTNALVDLERLVALRPGDTRSMILAGRFFKATGNHRRATELARACLALDQDNLAALMLAAECLNNLHEFETAERYYQKALALGPENPMTRWVYAMQQLADGRFTDGWQGYDARYDAFGWATAMYPFDYPRWEGQSLSEKTILVHGEQGLGDEIMFASILPELIEEAGCVVVGASPVLASLFVRSFPGATVYVHNRSPEAVSAWKQGEKPPAWCDNHAIDYQCPIGSLARRRRPDAASFPGTSYLTPDPDKVARFERQLRAVEGEGERPLRIGLNLTANLSTGLMGLEKSIPKALFEPVFEQLGDVAHFISLHPPGHAPIHSDSNSVLISSFAEDLVDFDATAALLDTVDVVVTTDTSVTHLAGALGKPTLVMLKFSADWRYLDDGDQCIWYDSARLIRQSINGSWNDVIEKVLELLMNEYVNTQHA